MDNGIKGLICTGVQGGFGVRWMVGGARWLVLLVGTMMLMLPWSGLSQVKNKGIPQIINYSKKVYGGGTQNWSVAQDNRGFMYFGNNDGLLEFDGARWKRYSLTDHFLYRAVYVSNEGTIYVGMPNDFGYMSPDENGTLRYVSISALFPETAVNFSDIWKIIETPDGIYFQSKNKIFLYKNQKLEVILPQREFNFLFKAGKTLYTAERHSGLVMLKGNRTERAPGGGFFIGKSIESVMAYDDRQVLIGTAKDGLYLYDGKSASPWAPEASAFLREHAIFCGTQLTSRYFVFGTIRNGVLIIDRNGTPVQHLNQDKGLQNNTVLSVYADQDNNLWLGLDRGISYIETNSPLSYYNYGKELPGTGYASLINGNLLYAGTNQGLFYKEWTDYELPLSNADRFEPVPGTQGQVWSLRMIDNTLFCGHNNGTFLVNGRNAEWISDIPAWDFLKSSSESGKIISGTYSGMTLISYESGSWKLSATVEGFEQSTRLYVEDGDGSLWIAHGGLGIFHVFLSADLKEDVKVVQYTRENGLPSSYNNAVFKINNEILFATVSGIYRFNRENKSFEADPNMQNILGPDPVNYLAEDPEGNIWFFKPSEIGIIHSGGGEARRVEKRPFYPLKNFINRSFEHLIVIDQNNAMIACEEGFAHYDPSFPVKYPESRNCFIRAITGGGDSIRTFFGGYSTGSNRSPQVPEHGKPKTRIPYAFNNVRIEFAVPLFDHPGETVYSYILEGYEDNRSDWSSETYKEYTRLTEGRYVFRVRGKSIYNSETPDAEFSFRVLPPWYRSLVAFIFYAFLIFMAIAIIIRLIIKKIKRGQREAALSQERELNHIRQQLQSGSLESEKRLAMMEKERLEADMALKTRQLAQSVTGLVRKNEFLFELKEEIAKVSDKISNQSIQDRLRRIVAKVNNNLDEDIEYEQFEDHFDAVHDNFLKNIKKRYPQLTPKDLRLCAYLRMNLSTKEIAPLLNISPRGVEISRYRLRKKMNLPHDINLIDLMFSI